MNKSNYIGFETLKNLFIGIYINEANQKNEYFHSRCLALAFGELNIISVEFEKIMDSVN